jgi:hypothetical protein
VREVAARLSDRDWAILADVERLGVASAQQLRRLHYEQSPSGSRLARMDLARLVKQRVLSRLDRRIGGVRSGSDGFVYALDVLGQRLLDPEAHRVRTPWTPGASHLGHALAVSDLYMRLWEYSGDWQLVSYETEPTCWRSFHGPGGQRVTLKPDALVSALSGDYDERNFIEIDQATEATTRIAAKARLYVRYWQSGREQISQGVFPRVVWVTPNERRRDQLAETLANLDAEHWQLFVVTTTEDAVATITGSFDATSERQP